MKNLVVILVAVFIFNISYAQNLEWVKKFGSSNVPDVVGHSNVAVDASGNVYTIGSFYFQLDFDPGPGTYILSSVDEYDIFVSKLDASGNFIWAKSFGGTGSDYGRSVTVDVAGNVILAGTFKNTVDFNPGSGIYNITSNGDFDIFIVKLDFSGNFLWAGGIGGTEDEYINSITVDDVGNIYTTGFFEGSGDYDPSFAGSYYLNSSGYPSTFILSVNSSGNFQWAKAIEGTGANKGNSISVDASGYVIISGGYGGTIDFDPGPQVYNVSSTGAWDIYLLKLDAAGNFVWAKVIDHAGTGWNHGSIMSIDALGNVYAAGYFTGTADFDPGSGIFNLTSLGVADIFIFKLDVSGNFVWAKLLSGTGINYYYSIGIVVPGNLYITGSFGGDVGISKVKTKYRGSLNGYGNPDEPVLNSILTDSSIAIRVYF
jgi:hypothetical protein